MVRQRMVITDFDGTLLNDDKTISKTDWQTLEQLGKRNIVTAIATGRSIASFEKAIADAAPADKSTHPLPVDWVIFSTGAGIMAYKSRDVIFKRAIPASGIEKVTRFFERRKMDYMVLKSIPDTHFFEYKSFGMQNPDFQHRLALYAEFASPLKDGGSSFDKATEVMAIIPGEKGRDAVAQTRDGLPEFSVVPATSPLDHSSLWIEVFDRQVCKAFAAQWLCDRIGLDPADALAVGNDYNDLDLLEWAGKGFVVDNGPQSMKARFSGVSSNNQSGFSEAVLASGFLSG